MRNETNQFYKEEKSILMKCIKPLLSITIVSYVLIMIYSEKIDEYFEERKQKQSTIVVKDNTSNIRIKNSKGAHVVAVNGKNSKVVISDEEGTVVYDNKGAVTFNGSSNYIEADTTLDTSGNNYTNVTVSAWVNADDVVTNGTWHHYTMTHDGEGYIEIYVDGIKMTNRDGQVGNMIILKQALTKEQVEDMYNNTVMLYTPNESTTDLGR